MMSELIESIELIEFEKMGSDGGSWRRELRSLGSKV